jgi:leucyl-tRNA synthetase
MRVYEMFMGPFGQSCAWNTNGLVGARKFLDRVWNISDSVKSNKKVNGIGALIQLENGNFIFQKRSENIERNPGAIAPFGGGINADEATREALKRELKEELNLDLSDNFELLGDFSSHYEQGAFIQLFYVKNIKKDGLKLNEGQEIIEFNLAEALVNEKVTAFTKEVINKFQSEKQVKALLHKTIKKISEDIADFKFNTCISSLMILSNAIEEKGIGQDDFAKFIQILAPFAPHLAEEIWRDKFGNQESIFKSAWPQCDAELIKDDIVNLVVQINGKLRATMEVAANISEEEAKKLALDNENVKKFLDGKEIVKIIFVPGKLLNIVIRQ